ncbi:MAG: ABC transporter substrate-binding protein [Deltaproteobacteria bacterium]|nr:ABC transporter substrate-binding protein [Deltaproteobacteria bacterium]
MKKIAIILLIFLFAAPSVVFADAPLQTVEKRVNEVLSVLAEGSKDDKSILEKKKDQIRAISNEMFDYIELSKRTLGRNWNKLSVEQRKEFVPLYRDLLEGVYMDRILAYKDEKVEYTNEKLFSNDKAEVQTKVIAPSGDIPIFYRMIQKDNKWKVYDVIIEGVSLIKNYRSQFNDILNKQTPEELIKTLQEKAKAS